MLPGKIQLKQRIIGSLDFKSLHLSQPTERRMKSNLRKAFWKTSNQSAKWTPISKSLYEVQIAVNLNFYNSLQWQRELPKA